MPKIIAQYPEIESTGNKGSIVLGTFGSPGTSCARDVNSFGFRRLASGCGFRVAHGLCINWAAVEELKLSCHNPETTIFTTYIYIYIRIHLMVT